MTEGNRWFSWIKIDITSSIRHNYTGCTVRHNAGRRQSDAGNGSCVRFDSHYCKHSYLSPIIIYNKKYCKNVSEMFQSCTYLTGNSCDEVTYVTTQRTHKYQHQNSVKFRIPAYFKWRDKLQSWVLYAMEFLHFFHFHFIIIKINYGINYILNSNLTFFKYPWRSPTGITLAYVRSEVFIVLLTLGILASWDATLCSGQF